MCNYYFVVTAVIAVTIFDKTFILNFLNFLNFI